MEKKEETKNKKGNKKNKKQTKRREEKTRSEEKAEQEQEKRNRRRVKQRRRPSEEIKKWEAEKAGTRRSTLLLFNLLLLSLLEVVGCDVMSAQPPPTTKVC